MHSLQAEDAVVLAVHAYPSLHIVSSFVMFKFRFDAVLSVIVLLLTLAMLSISDRVSR